MDINSVCDMVVIKTEECLQDYPYAVKRLERSRSSLPVESGAMSLTCDYRIDGGHCVFRTRKPGKDTLFVRQSINQALSRMSRLYITVYRVCLAPAAVTSTYGLRYEVCEMYE